eukprot:CAMPEP_0172484444 /NCGR_PEP_ID=MMETSP1066-20121228/11909_1 /TAXON_ID=671091 /ORGANISM="Coscinodiscus wailesii, Strain CCMP2513" /LENGTH=457 /DNA_ID=CAMNT_0013248979 /DNA_START=125 /DNA_END=1498 /DNA_ORIENTATION=+
MNIYILISLLVLIIHSDDIINSSRIVTVALAFSPAKVPSSKKTRTATKCYALNRRDVIKQSVESLLLSGVAAVSHPGAATAETGDGGGVSSGSSDGYSVYGIVPDPSPQLYPALKPVTPQKFMSKLSSLSSQKPSTKGGVIWLGEHHNSLPDHELQTSIIQSLHSSLNNGSGKRTPLSIGLEQIQIKFQNHLDAFVAGDISEKEMITLVEWDTRWSWPYEVYRPVFNLARELGIPLVALNVNSEDLALVEKDGLPGLDPKMRREYIPDPIGFATFLEPQSYRTYVNYVIRPSYALHRDMGLLRKTMSGQTLDVDMPFQNFFSGRVLWDESMASHAYRWVRDHPGGVMVGLVGADHVKFQLGVQGRFERFAAAAAAGEGGGELGNVSVLLNPTLIDSRPSGSISGLLRSDSARNPGGLTLQLRYVKEGLDMDGSEEGLRLPDNTGGVLSLADYIVISA